MNTELNDIARKALKHGAGQGVIQEPISETVVIAVTD